MKMKAGVLTVCGAPRPFAKSKPIHVIEVDLDPPGEGEVLVKVGGGGLCHSDLSLINGDRPRHTRRSRRRRSDGAPACRHGAGGDGRKGADLRRAG